MKTSYRQIFILLGMAVFLFQSCSTSRIATDQPRDTDSPTLAPHMPSITKEATATGTTSPSIEETEEVTFTPGEETVQLWAGEAIASSNRDDHPYHASQAAGEPNTYLPMWRFRDCLAACP